MWSYERDGRWWGWSFVRGSTVHYYYYYEYINFSCIIYASRYVGPRISRFANESIIFSWWIIKSRVLHNTIKLSHLRDQWFLFISIQSTLLVVTLIKYHCLRFRLVCLCRKRTMSEIVNLPNTVSVRKVNLPVFSWRPLRYLATQPAEGCDDPRPCQRSQGEAYAW